MRSPKKGAGRAERPPKKGVPKRLSCRASREGREAPQEEAGRAASFTGPPRKARPTNVGRQHKGVSRRTTQN